MLPCRREVGTESGRSLECRNGLAARMTGERSPMEQLISQLEPPEKEIVPMRGLGAQRIETRLQRQLLSANQTLVPGGKRIDVADVATHPCRIALAAEPTFHLAQAPGAQPAGGVGGLGFGVGIVCIRPCAGGDALLGLEKPRQAAGCVRQGSDRQRTGKGTLRVPDRDQDPIGQRIPQ